MKSPGPNARQKQLRGVTIILTHGWREPPVHHGGGSGAARAPGQPITFHLNTEKAGTGSGAGLENIRPRPQ